MRESFFMDQTSFIMSLDKINKTERILKGLKRLNLYYISRDLYQEVPVILTHFYEHGLKFRVLIKTHLSYDGFYHIRYSSLLDYDIKPMKKEDIPLHIHNASPNLKLVIDKYKIV
jgi:hypothetical protein